MSNDELNARTKIIKAATKLFAEKGLDATSTRDIARESGMNVSLISYYFGGKESLYVECFRDFAEQAGLLADAVLASQKFDTLTKDSFQRHMKKIIKTMMELKVANPHVDILLQRELVAGLPHAREVFESKMQGLLEKMVSFMRKAQDQKIIRADLNLYFHFTCLVHSTEFYLMFERCGLSLRDKMFQFPRDIDLCVDQVYKIFIEGVCI